MYAYNAAQDRYVEEGKRVAFERVAKGSEAVRKKEVKVMREVVIAMREEVRLRKEAIATEGVGRERWLWAEGRRV